MSDYPQPPPYGANYGGQPQMSAPYLQPAYPNPYPQTGNGHPAPSQYAQSYDASMNAYGYNQSIPVFGATPASAPGAPPMPVFQGWNQDHFQLPAYAAPQNNTQYPAYGGNSYNTAQTYPPVEQQSYQQNSQYMNRVDEGELSEGEFDDTYAPTNPAPAGYRSTQYRENHGTGYMGTAHRAVYNRTHDHNPLQSSHTGNDYYPSEPSQAVRQNSGSYSPYNPSKVVDQDERAGTNQYYNSYAPGHGPEPYANTAPPNQNQNQPSWKQKGAIDSSRPGSRTNGNHVTNSQEKSVEDLPASTPVAAPGPASTANTPSLPTPVPSASNQVVSAAAKKSLADARKEAQGAILNLYPFQIRFQTYVDEGFDETIIGRVFDDLGLARSPSKSVNGVRSSQNASDAEQPLPANASHNELNNQEKLASTPSNSEVGTQPKANEMVQGNTNVDAPTVGKQVAANETSTSPSTNTTSAGPPAKPAATTEKERTLQMKMEALRKSREQRAQKAAAKNDPVTPAVPVPVSQPEPAKPSGQTEALNSSSQVEPPKSGSSAAAPPTNSLLPEGQNQVPNRSPSQPISRPVNTQQTPAIPGLFRVPTTTSPAPTTTPSNAMNGPTNGSQRKRPVAADFDTPITAAFKRPFGQSRNETPLVIDVSEEEPDSDDEDVAMELESQADQDSPAQVARKMSDQRSAAIQNLPPLTNFPARKPFTPPPVSSAASTPPARKIALGKPEVLQEKEIAIEALRKKIAEAEAAKALKKAKQTASGTRTPRTADNSADDANTPSNGGVANQVEASVQMQRMISIAEDQVILDQRRLAEAQAAEVEKAAELQRNAAEQKRLRREQLATDLPRVDAEVQQNQLKLEQLRAEMAKIEAAVQKNLDEKRRMAEEMEKLGQEAEDRLQAHKDRLRDLTNGEAVGDSDSSQPSSLPATEVEVNHPSLPASNQEQPSGTTSPDHDRTNATQIDQRPALTMLNGNPASASNPTQTEPAATKEPTAVSERSKDDTNAGHMPEAALQEAVPAAADSHAQGGSDDMNIEDSYAPDPSQLSPESTSSPMDVDNRSPSYSPVLGRAAMAATSDRDDDYEPPDATPPVAALSPVGSPPFSPAPPEPVTEDIVPDNSAVSFPQATNENETEEHLPQPNGSVPLLTEDGSRSSNKTQLFTPYESPLKRFRAFRFHPEFNKEVSGGLRSLTYSHKIDPTIEFCPWEMAGGACNDQTCEYQHIKDIRLPDDDILKTLGSQDEFSGDQRARFVDGLKDALGAIRERKIRDFDNIAKEIIAHRRRFLGDDSKVLPLEGVSI